MRIVGKIITVNEGEIYLLTDDPEIHLEPLTRLAIVKGQQRRVTYNGKAIPVYNDALTHIQDEMIKLNANLEKIKEAIEFDPTLCEK